jgi:ribosomal protein S21
MAVEVEVSGNSIEALEFAIRKFRKKMEIARIMDEFNKRQFYLKPSLAKREKKKARNTNG